jgi:acyl-CoA thioesterase II
MTSPKPSPMDELLRILDLEVLEHNLFRGQSPQNGWKRIFGGQVIGQALVAACRTVDGRKPHSLHAYFLLGGDPSVPVIYEVTRIRDGRSFTTRNVLAIQHGEAIFSMSASFHVDEPGYEHEMPLPDVPRPADLPDFKDMSSGIEGQLPAIVSAYFLRERAIEIKPVNLDRYMPGGSRKPGFSAWIRSPQALPDDPVLHHCILSYASDMLLLDTSLIAHGRSVFDPDMQSASLDHALWFHRPFRIDEWLLYAQDSPASGGARGFSRGLIYDQAGHLVASVAQEGLIRPRPDRLMTQ